MFRLLLLVSLLLLNTLALAKGERFNQEKLVSNLGTPWGMVFIDSRHLLITEREGYAKILDITSGEVTSVSGLPRDIRVERQGGLFDVAVAPNFAEHPWLYFSYNKDVDGQGATTLARAKLEGNELVQWQDLLVTQSRTNKGVHYGGRITFDNDGHVFMSVGERGVRANAQNLNVHAGSILRLNLDGSVPDDNPFVGKADALPEIWSYGHRNPQGLFFNAATGQLWESEHGPRGGDEINLIEAGKNYGWPEISYGKEYWGPIAVGEGTEKIGMEQPVKVYVPSIATSSLIQYRSDAIAGWQGSLLVGALRAQHINRVELGSNNKAINEQRLLRQMQLRIRNIIENEQGELFVSTDNGDIFRLTPKK